MDKLDAALADVVTRLSELTAEHGDKAVDLTLWAYQVEATRELAVSAISAAALGGVAVWLARFARRSWTGANDIAPSDAGFVAALGAIGALLVGATGLAFALGLLSPARWLAAFGHPELMLATKALNAAGLL